jgi:L-ribulokinase
MPRYAIGLDFGTLSARAAVVDVDSGEARSFEHVYRHGIIESDDGAVARQEPADYLEAAKDLLAQAAAAGEVVGIGIAATASTPIPVDSNLEPIAQIFSEDLDAKAWLWKDHSAQSEAEEITEAMRQADPARLARVGAYYAEWFWAKILRCARSSPQVAAAAHTWVEQCDFVTGNLTGTLRRGQCAAEHKALYYKGYPDPTSLPIELRRIAEGLGEAYPCSDLAGGLTSEWAAATGIPKGTPIAVGGVDAHLGAVGAGVAPGRPCLVLGTSACHMAVAPYSAGISSVPNISGIADDSIVPGMLGLEAGQAAFGDLLDWASAQLSSSIEEMSNEASRAPAGSDGVIVLDFHAGNRCPLADAHLAGVTLGQTLKTTRAETFRAVVEALAFGIRQILELFHNAGVPVDDLLACGGVAQKNDFVLQVISDVTGHKVLRSPQSETVALGAAIFGGIVGGAFSSVENAQERLCVIGKSFQPNNENTNVYDRLFPIWKSAQTQLGKDSDLIKRLLAFKGSAQR